MSIIVVCFTFKSMKHCGLIFHFVSKNSSTSVISVLTSVLPFSSNMRSSWFMEECFFHWNLDPLYCKTLKVVYPFCFSWLFVTLRGPGRGRGQVGAANGGRSPGSHIVLTDTDPWTWKFLLPAWLSLCRELGVPHHSLVRGKVWAPYLAFAGVGRASFLWCAAGTEHVLLKV